MKKELILKDLRGGQWSSLMILILLCKMICIVVLILLGVLKIVYYALHTTTMLVGWVSNTQFTKLYSIVFPK